MKSLRRSSSAPQSGGDESDESEDFNEDIAGWDVTVAIKSRFDTKHFIKACQVVRALQNPNKKLRRPMFENDEERILTYELTVAILKYSTFLNQALEASDFYRRNTNLGVDNTEEVLVVLYDLFERDFQLHREDPYLGKKFGLIQSAIIGVRTKVMAHLAKLRIQYQVTSVNHLLPENLRHQRHIDQNPLYAWVNLRRIKVESVMAMLGELGLQRSEFEDDILIQQDSYYVDGHHQDLLRFHSNKKDTIFNSSLVKDGLLVVQDKSACLPVYALVKAIFYREILYRNKKLSSEGFANLKRDPAESQGVATVYLGIPLLFPPQEEWYDSILETSRKEPKPNSVIVTHGGSGRTVAHLACLLQESVPKWLTRSKSSMSDSEDLASSISNKFIPRPTLTVIAFGIPLAKQEETLKFFRKQMQLTNLKMYSEDFLTVSPKDPRVKGACAILVNPPSSGSALKDPVAYVCTEGGDEDVLVHLSKFVNAQTNPVTSHQYSSTMQLKFLKHALTFSQIKLCLYTTCSLLPVENTDVVHSAVHNFKNNVLDQKLKIFRDILHQSRNVKSYKEPGLDVVQLDSILDFYTKEDFQGPYLQLKPSSASSGCFMALLRRKEATVTVGRLILPEPGGVSSSSVATSNPDKPRISAPDLDLSIQAMGAMDARLKLSTATSTDMLESALERLNLASAFSHPRSSSQISGSRSSTAASDVFRRLKRRSMTKRAIVQRVSLPTHASMAKRTSKWTGENKGGRGSGSGGTGAQRGNQFHLHGQHHGHHDVASCPICARHAKNFPDFRPK